jgi:hypothetical protein
LIEFNAEKSAGELLHHGSSHFNTVFFAHSPP